MEGAEAEPWGAGGDSGTQGVDYQRAVPYEFSAVSPSEVNLSPSREEGQLLRFMNVREFARLRSSKSYKTHKAPPSKLWTGAACKLSQVLSLAGMHFFVMQQQEFCSPLAGPFTLVLSGLSGPLKFQSHT